MLSFQAFGLGFLIVFPLSFIYALLHALKSPLFRIPGPYLARFTRLWYLREIYRGHFEKTNVELHRKYGKIVRIAPNEFSIDDPQAAKVIYGHGSHFNKADWYYGWAHPDPARFTLFTDRNAKRHAAERRKMAAFYTMSAQVSYEGFVDNCASLLQQRFEEFASVNMTINMGHWLQCYSFDVIGEITFSKRFGFLDAGQDIGGIMASLHNKMLYSTLVGMYPSLHPFLFRVMSILRGSKGTGENYNVEFANQQIAERRARSKPTEGPPDFVTKFLEAHAQDPQNFTNYNILMGCLSNIVAGSDTTSITLSSIIYHLCKSPVAVHQLREEIDALAKDGTVSDPVTFKEAQKMPCLQAVIKEGLRIHPAAGLPLARVVPEGGATLAGQFFRQGTVVGINCWVAHQNTSVFGSDANTFRPERWLDKNDGQLAIMERYFIPFGMGSRTCIGKNISLLEISKLIPQLVRKFDFELEKPDKEWTTSNRWFVKPLDFSCKVSERKK